MTESTWQKTLALLDENEARLVAMKASLPVPGAKLCCESAHRTLGHLTSCQAAWLPILHQIRDGAEKGSISINPNPLFSKLRFYEEDWAVLLERFRLERAEWRALLSQVDVRRPIQMTERVYTAQTLTKRVADHERAHLDGLDRSR